MSKDEYLITDAPLKALTVFAMPMILGKLFRQISILHIILLQFVQSAEYFLEYIKKSQKQ